MNTIVAAFIKDVIVIGSCSTSISSNSSIAIGITKHLDHTFVVATAVGITIAFTREFIVREVVV